jgi:hypothetical protein
MGRTLAQGLWPIVDTGQLCSTAQGQRLWPASSDERNAMHAPTWRSLRTGGCDGVATVSEPVTEAGRSRWLGHQWSTGHALSKERRQ